LPIAGCDPTQRDRVLDLRRQQRHVRDLRHARPRQTEPFRRISQPRQLAVCDQRFDVVRECQAPGDSGGADDAPRLRALVLYQTEDGQTRIQCWFEGDTIWLTQALLADLFQKDVRRISEQLVNIYDGGELPREATPSRVSG